MFFPDEMETVTGLMYRPVTVSDKKLCRVLWNFEWSGVSRPTLNGAKEDVEGLPDTCKLLYPVPVDMVESIQWFMFDQLKFARPDWDVKTQLVPAWASIYKNGRAFNDRVSWDNGYADYIQKKNLGFEPMKIIPITCGGNVHEVLSGKLNLGGKQVCKIRTLDPTKPLSVEQYNYKLTPELVFAATISRREMSREDIEIPFWQLGGVTVPIPLFSKGGYNYIEAHRIEILSEGSSIPSPYRM